VSLLEDCRNAAGILLEYSWNDAAMNSYILLSLLQFSKSGEGREGEGREMGRKDQGYRNISYHVWNAACTLPECRWNTAAMNFYITEPASILLEGWGKGRAGEGG